MKKFVLFLFVAFLTFSYSANAQDPLLLEATEYYNKGSQLYSNRNYSYAIEDYKVASEKFAQLNDKNGAGYCYKEISRCYMWLKEYENVFLYLNKALEIFRETGLKWQECHIYNNFGYTYYLMGDYKKALEYYDITLKIERETKNKEFERDTLKNIITLYRKLGEENRILESYKKYEKLQMEIYSFFTLYRKALELIREKKYDKSKEMLIESLEMAKHIGFKRGEIFSKRKLGWVCYKLEQNEDSLKYNLEALEMAREIDNRYEIAYSLQNLGYIYYKIGEMEKAVESFKESYIYAIKMNENEVEKDIKWALKKIEKGESLE